MAFDRAPSPVRAPRRCSGDMADVMAELDARPSDCLALAVRCGAPVFVVQEVWDALPDMAAVLEEMREKGLGFEESGEA